MTEAANYHEAGPDTQGDITDIDSIIEINGRGIVTTVEVGDLSRTQREEPPPPRSHKATARDRSPLPPA